jgi:hypothetical protein
MAVIEGDHGFEGVEMFEICNFEKVWEGKELLEVHHLVLLLVVYVNDAQYFPSHVAMTLISIIIVENVSEERLCFKMTKRAFFV